MMLLLPLTATAGQCAKDFCATVQPSVCLVEQAELAQCRFTIDVAWQSAQPQSVCAFVGDQQLQCWQNARRGESQYQLELREATALEFRTMEQQVLAQQTLKVLSRHPERRRRLVTPWSVF